MRLHTLFCASVLALTLGCKTPQSAAPVSAGTVNACPTGSAAGEWVGSGTDSTGHWAFSGPLRQDGTRITGKLAWKNTDNGSTAEDTVEGTVACDTRAFSIHTVKLENQAGSVAATVYTGTFGPDFASMSGTWDVGGGGQFTATRK